MYLALLPELPFDTIHYLQLLSTSLYIRMQEYILTPDADAGWLGAGSASSEPTMSILKKLMIVPPIALAAFVFVASGTNPKPPVAAEKKEKPTPVKIIGAKPITAAPSVLGYGRVQPGRSWDAVAQVAGSVVWTSDTLRNGLLIKKGSELLHIDPQEYELGLAQIDAQMAALDAKDETTRASLKIELRALELLLTDFERKKKLRQQGSTAQAAVDNAERTVLAARARVQSLESTLKLNTAERTVLSRQRDIAALNIDRTKIRAPFDIRLGTVQIAQGQYVNKGQKLFGGDGIDVAEIIAQFPVGALGSLLGKPDKAGAPLSTMLSGAEAVSQRHKRLKAKILMQTANNTVSWEAKVDRVTEAMDPKTRTRGIVLMVKDPYGKATPGQRPPLVRDSAVQVMLSGPAVPDRIAVPAFAVRKGKVMVVDSDKRLRFVPVKPAYLQGNIIVLKSGLKKGDKVIVSDMPAPVEGMLLAPRPDKKLQAAVIAEASGKQARSKAGSNDKVKKDSTKDASKGAKQ